MPLTHPTKQNPRWTPGTVNTVTPATPIPAIDAHDVSVAIVPPQPTLPEQSTKGTDFQFGEAQSIAQAPARYAIDFALVATLRNRRVFAWLWTNPSGTGLDYSAKCIVEFWRNNSKIGQLWLSEALSSVAGTVTESVPCNFVAGGQVTYNAMAVFVAQPTGTQPTQVILQAKELLIEADRVTVSAVQFINITGIRLWLGIESSEH